MPLNDISDPKNKCELYGHEYLFDSSHTYEEDGVDMLYEKWVCKRCGKVLGKSHKLSDICCCMNPRIV